MVSLALNICVAKSGRPTKNKQYQQAISFNYSLLGLGLFSNCIELSDFPEQRRIGIWEQVR